MATKEEIIEYVMNSPQNTNRSVLSSMLEHMEDTSAPVTVTIPVYVQDGENDPEFAVNITANVGAGCSEIITFKEAFVLLNADFNTSTPDRKKFYGAAVTGLGNTVLLNFYMPSELPGDSDKLIIHVRGS